MFVAPHPQTIIQNLEFFSQNNNMFNLGRKNLKFLSLHFFYFSKLKPRSIRFWDQFQFQVSF